MTTTLGVCNLCEAICGLELAIEGGRVTAIRGNDADPLSRGHICPKGVALADIHSDPDRLRTPIKKVDGEWVETTWDDALAARNEIGGWLAEVQRLLDLYRARSGFR